MQDLTYINLESECSSMRGREMKSKIIKLNFRAWR